MKTFVVRLFGYAVVISCLLPVPSLVSARSESSMKCGTRYISLGASLDEVQSQCGPPSSSDSYERPHPSIVYDPGLDRNREVEAGTDQMEVWVYDRGSTKFVRTLTFENGKLLKIESGDYGG